VLEGKLERRAIRSGLASRDDLLEEIEHRRTKAA
jgi:hypothetical protein